MSDFGDPEEIASLPMYQGKIIVLGDSETGKSSLVKSLKPVVSSEKSSHNSSKIDVFSVVEMAPQELKYDAKVLLKFWEYSGNDGIIFV
jgi:GTPase SAR1 family protein